MRSGPARPLRTRAGWHHSTNQARRLASLPSAGFERRGRLDATRNQPAETSLLGLSRDAEALWSDYRLHLDVIVARLARGAQPQPLRLVTLAESLEIFARGRVEAGAACEMLSGPRRLPHRPGEAPRLDASSGGAQPRLVGFP